MSSNRGSTHGIGDPCCCFSNLKLRWRGKGSSASVYQIYYSNDCPLRMVAKVFFKSEGRAACEKEYNILKELQNDNIVKCVGKPKYLGRHSFLLLEMMPKGSLRDLYRKTQIKPEEAKCYVRQILQALVHIHELGIVHRDIKCANILIGEADVCKLADFGSATKLEGGEELQSGKGDLPSFFWTAPEVYDGVTYGHPADIFSFGCSVLEMHSRNFPFQELKFHHQVQVAGKIPRIPEYLPEDIREFIRLCIQKDPKKRPTALQLLEHDYVRVREGTSSSDNDKSFCLTDQFNRVCHPSFMDGSIDPDPLPASQESQTNSCCMRRASSWLDPRGVRCLGPFKTVEDVFCSYQNDIPRENRNRAAPNHRISECIFLQLEDE